MKKTDNKCPHCGQIIYKEKANMKKPEFESAVNDFCEKYLADIFSRWEIEWEDTRLEEDFYATVRCSVAERNYCFEIMPSPEDKEKIVLKDPQGQSVSDFLTANGEGMFASLWLQELDS